MKIIDNYRPRYLVQDSDFKFAGHRHGKYEANILLEGKIELTCGNDVFSVDEGHFAIWKPGVFHMSRVVSPKVDSVKHFLHKNRDGKSVPNPILL